MLTVTIGGPVAVWCSHVDPNGGPEHHIAHVVISESGFNVSRIAVPASRGHPADGWFSGLAPTFLDRR